ncbi:hypothetical protein ACWD4J_44000, partial [Streptomyces sp. NPDC002577]
MPQALRRFVEEQFGKLDEPTARRLWADASRITAEHNPFGLTVSEGAGGLLERDPEQYWATMRVAQVLHQNEGAPDRVDQAVEVAKSLAVQRGVAVAQVGLQGGAPVRDIAGSAPDGATASRPASGIVHPSQLSPEQLDQSFGPAVPPKVIRPGDSDDVGAVRLNPLWVPLEEADPRTLTANPTADTAWLYSVREDGQVVLGSETVSTLMGEEQFSQLLAGMREQNPALTEEELRRSLDTAGHPSVALRFAADEQSGGLGTTLPGAGRISGELRWDAERGSWTVNDQSGRYMSSKVRPDVTKEQVTEWLANMARLFKEHLGVEVVPISVKHGALPAATVAPTSGGAAAPADAAGQPQQGTGRQAGQQAGRRDTPTDPALVQFAERGKVTRQLWAEASRITAEHNPFGLTVSEGARGLLERDPEQYWATMRVAQVLHQNESAPDRGAQAVAAARALAAERGAGPAREGLLGGVAARMADVVEAPLVRDTAVVEAPLVRDAGDAGVPQADSLRTFLAQLDGTGASSSGVRSDVPSGEAVSGAGGVAPVTDLVPDGSLAPSTERGLRALYAEETYASTAREFEKRLGAYAFRQPSALGAVRQGVARLFDVLAQAHPDLSEQEIAKVFFADNVTSAGQIGADTGRSGLEELLEQGSVRELMRAFFNAAIENRSPVALKSLLREIADSGDWAKAERLGLDMQALRDQVAFLKSDLRVRLRAAVERV